MIDDLLDMSRILQGPIRLALEPLDLTAVAQEALDTVRPLAAAKNVQIAFDDAAGGRTIRGDAGRLQQVIWNLLSNAIRLTPDGGRVDVFIESANDHVEIRVVDTGNGLSPTLLPHVFERFRQADEATQSVIPDWVSGLGSSVNWWNCTGKRCRRPVPDWDRVRRSPFVCRSQPATLPPVKRPRSSRANRVVDDLAHS